MSKKPDFETSEEVAKLVGLLDTARRGDVISWPEISKLIGCDAQTEGKHYVRQARKVMRRDRGRVFWCVPTVGIKWLTEKELASLGTHHLRKQNRAVRRAIQVQKCLDRNDSSLTGYDIVRYDAHLRMLGMLYAESTHQKRRSAEGMALANSQLPKIPDISYLLGS